jgi:hypothetical protein
MELCTEGTVLLLPWPGIFNSFQDLNSWREARTAIGSAKILVSRLHEGNNSRQLRYVLKNVVNSPRYKNLDSILLSWCLFRNSGVDKMTAILKQVGWLPQAGMLTVYPMQQHKNDFLRALEYYKAIVDLDPDTLERRQTIPNGLCLLSFKSHVCGQTRTFLFLFSSNQNILKSSRGRQGS